MKTTLKMASILALVTTAAAAKAESNYPILESYRTHAMELIQATNAASSAQDVEALRLGHQALIAEGVEIMKLYAEKNPNCSAQFEVFVAEVPGMEGQTEEQVHSRYHNGVGLPTAPRHCYFGRSQVVHPVLNVIRMKGEWSASVRDHVAEDLDEVIEHLEKIEKNLNNPPN